MGMSITRYILTIQQYITDVLATEVLECFFLLKVLAINLKVSQIVEQSFE